MPRMWYDGCFFILVDDKKGANYDIMKNILNKM